MKSLVGAVAVLFLMTTFAMAGYQPAPFPQEANTALAGSDSGSVNSEMPASMAASQSEIREGSSPAEGSPFPSAANPSHGDSTGLTIPSESNELGSPFPAAASTAR